MLKVSWQKRNTALSLLRFTGSDRLESQFFPDLNVTVAEIIAFGKGI